MKVDFEFDNSHFKSLIKEVTDIILLSPEDEVIEELSTVFSCIDNTTLSVDDTVDTVKDFCRKTMQYRFREEDGVTVHVASVCVYPSFVATVKNELKGSGIAVASVAGGFPKGQIPLSLKASEVRQAVDDGADEVDIVINRVNYLKGDYQAVFDEIATAKEICGADVKLKVILETGELKTVDNIYSASMLAMDAGADFIKTSTGKISVGCTPIAAYCMLSAIKDFSKKCNRIVGFKASGGISDYSEALIYYCLTKKMLSDKIINNQYFRIGSSRITPQLFKFLTD